MQLHIGVRQPRSQAHAEVVIEASDGATAGDLLPALAALVDEAEPGLYVDGAAVDSRALLGVPPLVDGVLVDLAPAGGTASPAAPPDLPTLDVVGGPCAGQSWPLTCSHHTVGREAALTLADPDVSRQHCEIVVRHDGAMVRDLGSSNGTFVGTDRVGATLTPLPYDAVLRVGSCVLSVRTPAQQGTAPRPTGDGGLAFNRAPRVQQATPVVQVVVPAPPEDAERSPFPVLAMLLPLVLGVVMWRLLGNASFLLFTLLSPLLVGANVLSERRSGRRRSRRERARWRAARDVAERTLRDAVADDERDRRAAHPDAPTLQRRALTRSPHLWERRRTDPDCLLLRVGLADQPARVEAEGDLSELGTTAYSVPVTLALGEVGVLGVTGSARQALARWLVVQAATLHSPRELQLAIVTDTRNAGQWDWVRHLPHLRPDAPGDCRLRMGLGLTQAGRRIAQLHALIDERRRSRDEQWVPVLVVIDGARELRGVPGLASVLKDGPAVGILAVALDAEAGDLPGECRAVARTAGSTVTLAVHDRETVHDALLEGVTAAWSDVIARALAPLRDVSADRSGDRSLPPSARWTDVADLPLSGDGRDTEAVLSRWSARSRSTRVTLGAGPDGVFAVDLAADGPHALIAGTTGAGKSELLQTLIASLVADNRPDDLHLLLVDYKGGAAFGPCADLPHTVGMVTDLDGALVERALASLTAELKRRERVLATVGAKDLADLRRRGGHLPRLVIVVDEFASLAEELPDFVQGLVGISQRGRSLGVHLVLATQRPEGVVSADIRANTNLRVCLAVARDTESRDVLDAPVAATISRSTPGRAYARTGHHELTAFQTGRVGGRRPGSQPETDVAAPVVRVQVLPTAELGDPPPPSTQGPGDGTSDLALLVAACRAAAERLRVARQPSPWLPPLPEQLVLADLTARSATHLPLALVDRPETQSRTTYGLDLATDGHLLVIGAPRSGRTTALLALAGSVAQQVGPDDLHLYALDLGGGLGSLAALPHAGAVVGPDQSERMGRVLDYLTEQVQHRRQLLAATGCADLTEQRAQATGGERLPHLLLVIDRWESLLATFQDLDGGRQVEAVYRLLREGAGVGLHVVVTADRTGLVGRIGAMVEERLLLRLADPGDYAAAGISPRAVPEVVPPGRGWLLRRDPVVVQVPLLATDPAGSAQAAALQQLASAAPAPTRPIRRVAELPARVSLPSLRAEGLVLGVGGDELEPLLVDLSDGGFVIGGPARSGRSSALLTLAAQLPGAIVPIAPRASPLRDLPGCLTDLTDVAALEAAVTAPVTVLVDDAELVVDSPLAPTLEALVRRARDCGSAVVAAGSTDVLVTGYRGFVVELRRLRHGLLLCPRSPADGDLLGIRTSHSSTPALPGRGLLVDTRGVTPAQVALAPQPALLG